MKVNQKRKMIMKIRESVCFDDVLLEPQKSSINSRSAIDVSTSIGAHNFRLPIISSPMDTITESMMALTMATSGGLGIIHRYNTIQDQAEIVAEMASIYEDLNSSHRSSISAAIGASSDFMERAATLYGAGARILCIDVAHGHHSLVERALKTLRDSYGDKITLIAGNVATAEGFHDLSQWGADAIRVGIGGGSICSTRIQTGHGVPTLQSVLDCRTVDSDAKIIADGGIKNAGDVVKALAAGADFAMLGSMLAGTRETPGQIINNQYKVYRGMASPEAQIAWKGEARSLEGVSTTVSLKGDVDDVLNKISKNIRSGLSYTGALNLSEFRAKARFIKQSPSALMESNTHILSR